MIFIIKGLLRSVRSMYMLSNVHSIDLRVHSHWYESGYPRTGSRKHEYTCIPMVAVHIDTSSVQVRVTCEFHSYEQYL